MSVLILVVLLALSGCTVHGCLCNESQSIARDAQGNVITVQGQTGDRTEIEIKMNPKVNLAVCTC